MIMTIRKDVFYSVEMTAQQKQNLIKFLVETETSDAAYMKVQEIYGVKVCDEIRDTVIDLLRSLEES